jgi:hypothetical protein
MEPVVSRLSIGQHQRIFPLEGGDSAKTLDRRPCTGRRQEAVVIFLFGLEALLTRDSRVLSCAVSSSPQTIGCYWLLQ